MNEHDPSGAGTSDRPVFVIQKHAGPSLHYDVRLAIGGVLKSWAVPNGPSLDPRVKRLAVATEDRPLEHADFQGEVTGGAHGGGAIEIWDRGTYEIMTEKDGRRLTPEEAFEEGRLLLVLRGRRLVGGWSLHRTGRGKKSNWLMIRLKAGGGLVRRSKAKIRQATEQET